VRRLEQGDWRFENRSQTDHHQESLPAAYIFGLNHAKFKDRSLSMSTPIFFEAVNQVDSGRTKST